MNAQELMLLHLNDHQIGEYLMSGKFTVIGSNRTIYRIVPGCRTQVSGGRTEYCMLFRDMQYSQEYIFHLAIVTKLLIESSEEKFRYIASEV